MKTAPTTDITAHLASGSPLQLPELAQACGIKEKMIYKLLSDVQKVSGAELPTDDQGKRVITTVLRDLIVEARAQTKADKTLSFAQAVRTLLIEQGYGASPLPITLAELDAECKAYRQEYSEHLATLTARLARLEHVQSETQSHIAELRGFQAHVEMLIAESNGEELHAEETQLEEPEAEEPDEEVSEAFHPAAYALGSLSEAYESIRNRIKSLIWWKVPAFRASLGRWRRF